MPQLGGQMNSPQTGGVAAPVAPTTQSASNLLGSATWQKQVSGYLLGTAAGQLGQYGLQAAVGQEALGLSPYTLAVQEQNLTYGTSNTFANALLGYQGLGIQSQGLASQAGTSAAQQALEQAAFGVTAQKYPQEAQTAALTYANRVRAMQSGAAATGTTNTSGEAVALGTAAQQYQWQQATIYRQQQLAALGQQSEQIGQATKQTQFALGQQQLELTAKKQGISAQQAQEQLAFGLQQLGVKATPASLLQTIATAEVGGATAVRGLLSQAALIGGLGASFGTGG
jgi:hypothetical protein